MEIRFAKPVDLPHIVALERASFSEAEQISEAVLATYLHYLSKTCLVMETGGTVIGFVLSCPSQFITVSDSIFHLTPESLPYGAYLSIASLAVSTKYQKQGIGTLLLAALKEIAVANDYIGISLTCKEHLVPYYELNQFKDMGPSSSQFGGQMWYDMYWKPL